MYKKGILMLLSFITVLVMNAQDRYVADTEESTINWEGQKIIGSNHIGTINLKSGWLQVDGNTITGGNFVIDMNSIINKDLKDDSMKERLVGHLKSDDFFGVEKFPVSNLVITGGSEFINNTAKIRGNLTIKEATHPVEFTVRVNKIGDSLVYTAQIAFDRSLYEVRYGSGKFFSNLGDNAIKDEILLDVRLVVKEQA